ncbi:hypothetical protein B0H17DRAFT_1138742 [Mycena rosella]|uniref:Uncharacterized protein n=1 Tax=Mycena rosella TaxID=1033263 RepID=A0AAD7G9B6_MYCRO|nr:hypothetical protein B0H17DRAFT_1138742 [Mycena rosella]
MNGNITLGTLSSRRELEVPPYPLPHMAIAYLWTPLESAPLELRTARFPLPSSSWLIRVVSDCGNFDRIRGVSAQSAWEQHPIGEWPCFKDRDNDTTRPDLPPSRTILCANLFFSLLIAAPIVLGENHELRDGHEPTELLPHIGKICSYAKLLCGSDVLPSPQTPPSIALIWRTPRMKYVSPSCRGLYSLTPPPAQNYIDKVGNNNTIYCGSGSQEVVAIINPGSPPPSELMSTSSECNSESAAQSINIWPRRFGLAGFIKINIWLTGSQDEKISGFMQFARTRHQRMRVCAITSYVQNLTQAVKDCLFDVISLPLVKITECQKYAEKGA